jgi:hypothetical protein
MACCKDCEESGNTQEQRDYLVAQMKSRTNPNIVIPPVPDWSVRVDELDPVEPEAETLTADTDELPELETILGGQ